MSERVRKTITLEVDAWRDIISALKSAGSKDGLTTNAFDHLAGLIGVQLARQPAGRRSVQRRHD